MKKVGIVTTAYSYNWGAVLQAYALRTALNEQFENYQADIVHFNATPDCQSLKPGADKMKDDIEKKKHLFQNFRREKLGLNDEEAVLSLTSENAPDYDAFIFGSDGIWSTNVWQIPEFFGSFVPAGKRKIAYAPSIGCKPESPSLKLGCFEKYVKTFDYLSVRESVHCQFLQRYTDKEVHFVCDPTLLLDKNKYLSLIDEVNPKKPSRPYIFYYQPNSPDGAIISLVNKLARMHGYDVVHTFADIPSNMFHTQSISAKFVGPIEFLSYIKDASIVITRSYHAAIFSIIFEKPVYAYVDSKLGTRFESLFSALAMENHLIHDYIKPEEVSLTYDYQNAYDRLDILRKESKQYLTEALSMF